MIILGGNPSSGHGGGFQASLMAWVLGGRATDVVTPWMWAGGGLLMEMDSSLHVVHIKS